MIPARGGSKGVPGKNLCGSAAAAWSRAPWRPAGPPTSIDAVYVSTDDADIARAARKRAPE